MSHSEGSNHLAAIILARGGSKGIPRKNIKPLAGRPLIEWVLGAVNDSKVFDSVWVSTDDDEIENKCHDKAKVFRRSAEDAGDNVSSIKSIQTFLEHHPEITNIAMVQCTSPCLQPWHLQEPARMIMNGDYDSVFAVTRQHTFRWKEIVLENGESILEPLNIDCKNRPRRQDWKGELVENGAFYFTSRSNILEGMLQGGKIGCYEMAATHSIDIDYPEDWQIAEMRVREFGYNPHGPVSNGCQKKRKKPEST